MEDFEPGDLIGDQIDKVLQFQDLTGIDDLSICRDVLQRHNWNLEVAVQEQLNLYEGRPSMYAQESRSRPPPVVEDSSARIYFGSSGGPGSNKGIFSYMMSLCYNFMTGILQFLFSFFRKNVRPVSIDPVEDVMNFIHSYEEQYGKNHPIFYQGSYSQALSDAKQELRFLIVYLHKEESQEVDQWCRNTLANAEVIRFVNTQTLFWGCNTRSGEGFKVAESLSVGSYPFLAVIVLKDNKMTIVGRMEGSSLPNELIPRLQAIVYNHEGNLIQARQDRAERSLTQSLRQQQDLAYEESLRADQEKDRRKEQERRAREEEEAREREHIDAQEAEIQRIKMEKELIVNKIPLEPEMTNPNACHIQIKIAERSIKRRFLVTDTIEDVYNWIFSQPDSPAKFEITTSYPRRVLYPTSDDEYNVMTLSEAGLTSREVLHINNLEED